MESETSLSGSRGPELQSGQFVSTDYGSCEIWGAVPAARPDAMSDDRALKSWVSDQLHGLLGFAEGNLAS